MVNTYNNSGVNAKNHIGDISHNSLKSMIKKIDNQAKKIQHELLLSGSIEGHEAAEIKRMRRGNNDYHKKSFSR